MGLREYSKDFLQWVEAGRIAADSRWYCKNGWRLLEQTKIAGMRMDQINKEEAEKIELPGSASNTVLQPGANCSGSFRVMACFISWKMKFRRRLAWRRPRSLEHL